MGRTEQGGPRGQKVPVAICSLENNLATSLSSARPCRTERRHVAGLHGANGLSRQPAGAPGTTNLPFAIGHLPLATGDPGRPELAHRYDEPSHV